MARKRRHSADPSQPQLKRCKIVKPLFAPTLQTHLTTLLKKLLNGEDNAQRIACSSLKYLVSKELDYTQPPTLPEYELIAAKLALALRNPSKFSLSQFYRDLSLICLVEVDVDAVNLMCSKSPRLVKIDPAHHPVIDSPAVLVDHSRRILLWYLPDILAPYRVVSLFESLAHIILTLP